MIIHHENVFDFPLKYPVVLTALLGLSFDCLAIDDDGNGISDVFEQQHGGSLDPNEDADADGISNFNEYLFAGNPLLPGDLVQIFDSNIVDNEATITWLSVVGLRYVLEVSGDLNSGVEESAIMVGDGNVLTHLIRDFPYEHSYSLKIATF